MLVVWSILLFFLGLVLIILEVFLPTGGILGMLAAIALMAALALSFFASPLVGLTALLATVIAVPLCIALALRLWPSTPMGRRMLLGVPSAEDVLPDHEQLRELKQLVGAVGVAKSPMLPSGTISIGGRTIDAIAQGIAIDPGQRVQVVEVRGTRVFVRPVDESVELTPAAAADQEPENPLEKSIESFGIEDFEDPLLGNQA
jgi:membrane-bound serine protease (ClpP class)